MEQTQSKAEQIRLLEENLHRISLLYIEQKEAHERLVERHVLHLKELEVLEMEYQRMVEKFEKDETEGETHSLVNENTTQHSVDVTMVHTQERETANSSPDKGEESVSLQASVEEKPVILPIIQEIAQTPENRKNTDGDTIINEIIDKNLTNLEEKTIEKIVAEEPQEALEEEYDVTTDKGKRDFIKNNVVKFISGMKMSEKAKKISKKMAKVLIRTVAIGTFWLGTTTFHTPDPNAKVTKIKKEHFNTKTRETDLPKEQHVTFESLPPAAQEIYLYAYTEINEQYAILDKPTATIYVIGKDKKILDSFPAVFGAVRGEEQNSANPDGGERTDGGTTPAGSYTFGTKNISSQDSIMYKGNIFSIDGIPNEFGALMMIHSPYPKEKRKREKTLKSPNTEDNRMTWGCINPPEDKMKFIKKIFTKPEGNILFITPDDPNDRLNPKTGRIIDN